MATPRRRRIPAVCAAARPRCALYVGLRPLMGRGSISASAAVETHTAALYFMRWSGSATSRRKRSRTDPVVRCRRAPAAMADKTDEGIGVGVVLASLGTAPALPAEQWPPESQSDSDSDVEPAATPPPSQHALRPMHEPEFNGVGHHVPIVVKRAGYIGGSGIALERVGRPAPPTEQPRARNHDRPAARSRPCTRRILKRWRNCKPKTTTNFLRDLRLWQLERWPSP